MITTGLNEPLLQQVFRIRDVYPWSRIQNFSYRDPGSASKNLSILTQKIASKLSEIWSRLFIPDLDPDFLPIPDPDSQHRKQLFIFFSGLNKGSDPGPECFEKWDPKYKIIPDTQDCLASRVPELDAGVEGPGGQVLPVRVEFNTADGRLVTCRQ